MDWYEFRSGKLNPLSKLLLKPLEFDPFAYFNEKVENWQVVIPNEVLRFSQLYNDIRCCLLSNNIDLVMELESTSKMDFVSITKTQLPISYSYSGKLDADFVIPALEVKTTDNVNLQLDRMLESMEVRHCKGKSLNPKLFEYIKFYALSEVLFFLLTGIAKIEIKDTRFIVIPANARVKKQLHRKWFANMWDLNSMTASLAYFDMFPASSHLNNRFANMIDVMALGWRDKVFTLPHKGLPRDLSELKFVRFATQLCRLLALCFFNLLKQDKKTTSYAELERVGVLLEDIEDLKAALKGANEPDNIIGFTNNGVELNGASVVHQLRILVTTIASMHLDNSANRLLGHFFEKQYVTTFFEQDDIKENYKAYPGFEPHDVKSDELNPDIDLIIYDKRHDWYYFTQVKYIKNGGKAYLSGDFEHITRSKTVKGVRQLKHAKIALETGLLDSILADSKRKIENCTSRNTSFLLIHNVTNFDFCQWPSGVVSYEWNTIRNLFQDGLQFYGHSKSPPKVLKGDNRIPIEDPDEVIEYFSKTSQTQTMSGARYLTETHNTSAHFELGGTQFELRGLGL